MSSFTQSQFLSTPRRPRSSHISLDRQGLVSDLAGVPVVSVDFYLSQRCAQFPVNRDTFDLLLQALEKSKFITADGSLVDFDEPRPSSDSRQPEAFIRLKRVATRIKDAAALIPKHPPPKSDTPGPDFFLEQNITQQIYHGYHILRNDPRRMWTFGISIQDDQCRFWYFSRSHTCVTAEFNFIEDAKPLIHFLYAMTCASEEQLGFDSSMELVIEGGLAQYKIKVREKVYQTLAVLSDYKADVISGRAARVWEVKELNEKGKQIGQRRALKDSWLDDNSNSEKSVLDELKRKINGAGNLDDMALFNKCFMQILEGGPVLDSFGDDAVAEELAADDIEEIMSVLPGSVGLTIKRNVQQSSQHAFSQESISTANTISSTNRDILRWTVPGSFPKRAHHRTVFELVGIPYYDLESIPIMLQVIDDAAQALGLLWKYGFVHRDISSGNVYWDPDSKSGKLSDFEFAKEMSDQTFHNVKTGTTQFMAVEVALGFYKSRPLRTRVHKNPPITVANMHFCHNPLHDLESLWWLLIWSFIHLIPVDNSSTLQDQQIAADALFLPVSMINRAGCLYNGELERYIEQLDTRIQEFAELVIFLALDLVAEYERVEKTIPILLSMFGPVHKVFRDSIASSLRAHPFPDNLELKFIVTTSSKQVLDLPAPGPADLTPELTPSKKAKTVPAPEPSKVSQGIRPKRVKKVVTSPKKKPPKKDKGSAS
ncbi:hypothetical protein C8J56DRAFT_1175366 [Mycena floridula]|nr:hypothetical protein C8J56DRAFT_1175366 [Mycena floridula]